MSLCHRFKAGHVEDKAVLNIRMAILSGVCAGPGITALRVRKIRPPSCILLPGIRDFFFFANTWIVPSSLMGVKYHFKIHLKNQISNLVMCGDEHLCSLVNCLLFVFGLDIRQSSS